MTSADSACPAPRESLGALLSLVRAELVRAIEAELSASDIDLRFTQFQILKRLNNLGPMMATELARGIELDAGAMTRQLDQLERRGLLRRSPHQQDRRALRIELTDAGVALTARMLGCGDYVLAAAPRSLDAPEQARLHDYLERVLQTLREKS